MAKEGSYDAEVYQAYMDNCGEEYTELEDVEEAYQGQFSSDEEFAQELAEQIGEYDFRNASWPTNCIDWEQAAHELMYDYFESEGYYFRNM